MAYPVDPLTGKRKATVPPSDTPDLIRGALKNVGKMNTLELSAYLDIPVPRAALWIRRMRDAGELIRVVGWTPAPGSGKSSPVYALFKDGATRQDMPRPAPLSSAEQKRLRYAKSRVLISLQRNGKDSKFFRLNNIFGITHDHTQI